MNDRLPVVQVDGNAAIVDPDTGVIHAIEDAPGPVLANVCEQIDTLLRAARTARDAISDELAHRLGTNRRDAIGAHLVERDVRRNWDPDETWEALTGLVESCLITPERAESLMPEIPVRRPAGRGLNSLLEELVGEDPVAARALANARKSRTSIRVTRCATDSTAEAAA